MKEFIQSIIQNLENNGFPHKSVSFPTEKMYEIAEKKGLSFNDVRAELEKSYYIASEIDDERIIFKINMSPDIMAKAQEMMAKMTPEEMEKMREMMGQKQP